MFEMKSLISICMLTHYRADMELTLSASLRCAIPCLKEGGGGAGEGGGDFGSGASTLH